MDTSSEKWKMIAGNLALTQVHVLYFQAPAAYHCVAQKQPITCITLWLVAVTG